MGGPLVTAANRVVHHTVPCCPLTYPYAPALPCPALLYHVLSYPLQLGGPKVMAANGVVHHTVPDDFQGVLRALQWLAYVPPKRGAPLPSLRAPLLEDPVGRPVAYRPVTACDPRCAIQGQGGATWQGGIFDRGSFLEVWQGWARTVITGRARLGGIPMGVIAVETSSVQFTVPSDPARPETGGRTVVQVTPPNSQVQTHRTRGASTLCS